MSGPKVVRIVTREEVLAICRGLLARVDAALAEWTKIGHRNDCIDEEAITAAKKRRDDLARLISADRLMDLQKQAPIEEAFLHDDMQRRLAAVAAEQALARSKERRDREAGQTLLNRLSVIGPIDIDLAAELERGAPDALLAGFALLADSARSRSGSSALAESLRDESSAPTLQDWLASQPVPESEKGVERIAARLDELQLDIDPRFVSRWRERLAEAATAGSARRGLLLDQLEIETGRVQTDLRRRQGLAEELVKLRAELASSQGGASKLEAADAVENADADSLEGLIVQVRTAIEDTRARSAAAARRSAILKGLTKLGYEVTEGMSTSFVDDGHLVLRSASRPDYGVEVHTAADSERMQMRPVAFEADGAGPDPARDRDAETLWCGDVAVLQQALADAGSQLVIEKSLPIGATPIKRIAEKGAAGSSSREAPNPKQRSLR